MRATPTAGATQPGVTGAGAPPAPGTHDWQVVREWRDRREFRAVLAGRPAHGRLRQSLGRWLHPGRRATS
ncbi:hypothetical protein [Streptomyces gossypiisoli]|uniref:hypothetical protein n=1 Tax=Streptomyces gossypiisoli TaxID=2748864 RepID=UPI0038CD7BAE